MNAVLMWMRRTWVLGIVFIIIQCLTWFRYQEAYRDWSWTISLVQGATMLGSPFIAGVCAYIVHRQWPRTTRRDLAGNGRSHHLVSDMTWAVIAWGWAAQAVFLVIGCVSCVVHHADSSGLTLPWQLLTGPIALGASAWLGTLAACLWDSVMTIPVMVLAVFLAHQMFWDMHLPQLLSPEFATVPMSPMRPNPVHMALSILGNAGILVAAKAGCRWQQSPAGARSHGALATSITGMVALVVSCVLVATHPSADLIFI